MSNPQYVVQALAPANDLPDIDVDSLSWSACKRTLASIQASYLVAIGAADDPVDDPGPSTSRSLTLALNECECHFHGVSQQTPFSADSPGYEICDVLGERANLDHHHFKWLAGQRLQRDSVHPSRIRAEFRYTRASVYVDLWAESCGFDEGACDFDF